MVSDLLTRGAQLIGARWRMRLTLAALMVDVVMWSRGPYPHLATGAVALLLALFVLGRRQVRRRPPWAPPWQASGRRMRLQRVLPAPSIKRACVWAAHGCRVLIGGIRGWQRALAHAMVDIAAMPARLYTYGTRWMQTIVALPHTTRMARAAIPDVVSVLTGRIDRALADAGVAGRVVALESTARAITLTFAAPDLSAAQTRQIRAALRDVAPAVRWTGAAQLRVSLPFRPCSPLGDPPLCLPILRQRAQTLWWPLTETRPLIVVGDALPVLHAWLDMVPVASRLVLYDPEQIVSAPAISQSRWPVHTPDALAIGRAHALRTAYRRTHAVEGPPLSPLTLLVVAPDTAAWRDLTPLLTQLDDGGVRVILALTAGAHHPAAQDACRRGQVVEIGARGRDILPESCRPPGLAAPRPGMALAWQTPQRHWCGMPPEPTRTSVKE